MVEDDVQKCYGGRVFILIFILCTGIFTVYDRRESPLTPDEAEQYHIAKQKMLGNIKFIGKRLVSIQLINHYWILKCSNNCLRKCRGGKLIVYISMSRFLMKISID